MVAKQGETTMRATVLTIFLAKDPKKDGAETAVATEQATDAKAAPATTGSSVRRMEAKGSVTIISKDQVGTGDNGVYDKADNKVTLTGDVTLSQATNIIKGDRLVYDMTTGQAQVSSGQTLGRVRSVFTPRAPTPPAPRMPRSRSTARGRQARPPAVGPLVEGGRKAENPPTRRGVQPCGPRPTGGRLIPMADATPHPRLDGVLRAW